MGVRSRRPRTQREARPVRGAGGAARATTPRDGSIRQGIAHPAVGEPVLPGVVAGSTTRPAGRGSKKDSLGHRP
eukprot:11731801-Alexandrium_andersonii.AAC.1